MVDPHRAVADALRRARDERSTTTLPSEGPDGFTMGDALAVARLHEQDAVAEGRTTGGLKVGLTYVPIWSRIGVDEPFVAPMPAGGIEDAGATSLEACTAPRLEVEVVLALGSPLAPGAAEEEVLAAISGVALGFELVDSHYRDWRATPPDLVADFGCHAGLRTGELSPLAPREVGRLESLEVRLTGGDGPPVDAFGRDVLGGPVAAVAAALRCSGARPVPAGHLVSTGSLTGRAHPVVAGQTWIAEVVAGPHLAPCRIDLT
jgi:2-keto-4-pentenoate hydratase